MVMATAALSAIRRRFATSQVTHLMRSYVAEVLEGLGLCDDVLFWPEASRPAENGRVRMPGGLVGLVRELRRRRYELALLLTNSFRSALVARLAGIGRRVGYARDGRGWLLSDRLVAPRRDGEFVPVPALDYYNELARRVGCEDVGDRLVLATTPEDEAAIDRRLGGMENDRPLVALNPGANYGSAKCWPAEHYAALADALVRRHGARVVASLGPKERWIAERLRASAAEAIEVFIEPPLGLGPLKALVRRCDVLVTNDTGPRHFAAAFGAAVVTIFGSSDPAWTETRYAGERIVKLSLECQPCMERVCPLKHHNCMNQLAPEMVLKEVEAVLASRKLRAGAGMRALPVRR